jgi:hypothetical protein
MNAEIAAERAADRLRVLVARGSWPLAAGLAAFVFSVGVLLFADHDKPSLRLDVAFSANACCAWQVWVNGARSEDITVLRMKSGSHATYSVPLYVPRIQRLRMPIGQVPGGTVTIRRIWIERGGRTVATLDPRNVHISAYVARRVPTASGVAFQATGTNPFLDIPASLDTHEGATRLFLAKQASQPLNSLAVLLLFGALLTVAFALSSWRRPLMLVAVGLIALAVQVLPALTRSLGIHDDVSKAVGNSSYAGIPKLREELLFALTALIAFAIPALVVAAWRFGDRRAQPIEPPPPAIPNPPLHRWVTRTLVGVPLVLVALASMPDLRATLGYARTVRYTPSWDSNNLIFWQYLTQTTTLEPVKDFFWPYGFQWIFGETVPWGPLWLYSGYLSFWAFLSAGTYLALARFFSGAALVRRVFFVSAFWTSVELAGHVVFYTRYVAPLAVVLLFVGIDPRERLRSWKRLLFAVALFELVLFEIAQAGYALVPIGFLLLVEAVAIRRRAEILRWAGRASITVGGPLAAAALVLAATGQLGATVEYFSQIGAVAAGDGWPSTIDSWLTRPTSLAAVVFWAVPITIGLGTVGLISGPARRRGPSGVVVALGLLGLMMMQKQVLRPPIETQLWLPVVFGLVFWATTETSLHRVRRWSAVTAFAGALGALLLVSGGYRTAWDSVTTGPQRLFNSVDALLHQRGEFRADGRAQFAPERFAKFSQYQPVVRALRQIPEVRAGGQVWILGDDSPITMLLRQGWPYYFNDVYDTSPIAFQQKVIRRLELTPPSRVVWNFAPAAMTFDTVPNVVRVPLLFQWAVQHLVPDQTVSDFAILRRRGTGETISLAWWRRRIGAVLNLGHIPEATHLGGQACTSGSTCGFYLVVRLPPGRARPAQVTVPIRVAGLPFALTIQTSSSVRRYVVPLERLWFWSGVPATEARSVAVGEIGGAQVTVVRRRLDPDVLY